jgi:hypothetical protein
MPGGTPSVAQSSSLQAPAARSYTSISAAWVGSVAATPVRRWTSQSL